MNLVDGTYNAVHTGRRQPCSRYTAVYGPRTRP